LFIVTTSKGVPGIARQSISTIAERTRMDKTVGIVGLDIMGGAIARNLCRTRMARDRLR
jgi:hypothetical protein